MTSSLCALVLSVAPPYPVTTPGHLGRAVYHFLLRYIGQYDSSLEQVLHNTHDYKPFTCSTLVGGLWQEKNSQRFVPDNPAWLRLTSINETVTAHLQRLADNPPWKIELDGIPFCIQAATTNTKVHSWAGLTSYEQLAAPYLLEAKPSPFHCTLDFTSPTSFRISRKSDNKTRTWPVPMPNWVFGSLYRQWNQFSPIPLPEDTCQFIEDSVVLSRYQLNTRAIPFKGNIPQMGCVGKARYVFIDDDPYWARILHLLAAYAFYAGVGYQTTTGFGQVRPLPSSEW